MLREGAGVYLSPKFDDSGPTSLIGGLFRLPWFPVGPPGRRHVRYFPETPDQSLSVDWEQPEEEPSALVLALGPPDLAADRPDTEPQQAENLGLQLRPARRRLPLHPLLQIREVEDHVTGCTLGHRR